jgi:hypothetical protein
MNAPTDSVTVLRCARQLRQSKIIRPNEIIDYSTAKTFDGFTATVGNLDDLGKLIARLMESPRLCVVRGELVAGRRAEGIRRLVHQDPETGEPPTLRDAPRRWLALDVEGVERPADVAAGDIEACARVALTRLPWGLQSAACVAQATAGHGIKPGIRLRLWYWLDRPTWGAELKRWLNGTPCDPAVFSAGQVIYTAAPVFEGCEDHLPHRITCLNGARMVAVPSPAALAPAPPSPEPERTTLEPGTDKASRYGRKALERALAAISTAPVNSRHDTARREASGLAKLVGRGLLHRDDLVRGVGIALQRAGKTRQEGEAVAVWALSHRGEQ